MAKTALFWFRRDLRIEDNFGLFKALQENDTVIPIFIFDTNIIQSLDNKDKRITFIYNAIREINKLLIGFGSSILVLHNNPLDAFKILKKTYDFQSVYCNEDYEPHAIKRDLSIKAFLKENLIDFKLFKDQVIFSKNDVLKPDNKPYTIFTPYKNKWLSQLTQNDLTNYSSNHFLEKFKKKQFQFPEQNELGFSFTKHNFPLPLIDDDCIANYEHTRDFPALDGTSRLGIHLRFGTISIRQLVKKAKNLSNVFLNELIWREFYMMILYHFPNVITNSFKSKYDNINWRNNKVEFECWCEGNTGYPMVDAGMRELNATGFMHNRARMITASFLTKHLLCDWRLGEAYFAEKLFDFELSSNNGGWQWAAGTGCDAAPYFRIFNPASQQKKFDFKNEYVKKWIPEFNTAKYPEPIVEHTFARERCLAAYKSGLF